MKLNAHIGKGEVKIDFDYTKIKSGKLQDIYEYIEGETRLSRVAYNLDEFLLSKGVIEGRYNSILATDAMIEAEVQHLIEFLQKSAS